MKDLTIFYISNFCKKSSVKCNVNVLVKKKTALFASPVKIIGWKNENYRMEKQLHIRVRGEKS